MHANMKKILRGVIQLSMSMAGSRLVNLLNMFIGMIFVAQLGHSVLAASALITATFSTLLVISLGMLFAVSVLIGRLFGAEETTEIGKAFQQALILAAAISVILSLAFWKITVVLSWLHQNPALLVYIRNFFHTIAWGAPSILLFITLSQLCFGVLKQRLVLQANILGLLVFIPFSYAIILGHWGLPRLGVEGLALALILKSIIANVYLLMHLTKDSDFQSYELFKKHYHKGLKHLRQMFIVGWPLTLQFGGELTSFFVVSVMIGWIGATSLAANQIVNQWAILMVVPVFSISEATGILVGQAFGAKRFADIRTTGYLCIGITLICVIVIMSLFFFAPSVLALLYLHPGEKAFHEIMHLTYWLFFIGAFNILFDMIRNVSAGALRGLLDTQYAMWIGLIIIWLIGVPVGYWMAFSLHWGVIGFRIARCIGMLVGAIAVYPRWHIKSKKCALQ